VCSREQPELRQVIPGHKAACHFAAPYPIDVDKLDVKIIDESALFAVTGEV
jgi:hypothetical protein